MCSWKSPDHTVDKPQVLVFIDWYAPGFKAGGPVRSVVNLVDRLRDRIDFHIVTSDTDYTETVPYRGIVADQWTRLPGGEQVWYASAGRRNADAWKLLMGQRPWDAVYLNGMYSPPFSVLPLWLLRGTDQRKVVAVRGMLAHGMMRHGTVKKRLFLAAMRLLGCYKGVVFQATNEDEARDVRKWISASAEVQVVPNLGRKLRALGPAERVKEAGVLRLVSIARIAVEKNTLFAIERLREVTGNITFDLYGPVYDQSYWGKCQQAIATLPANIRVEHIGVLEPERVQQCYENYHALFMPSQGENFGHSMAEALATGLPLLISDRTPWKELERQQAGWDVPLETPERFVAALRQLTDADQTVYDRWSAGAFTLGARYLNDPGPVEHSYSLFKP